MMLRVHVLTIFLMLLVLVGCASPPLSETVGSNQKAIVDHSLTEIQQKDIAAYEYQLFFGLSKPDGGEVSLTEWSAFELDIISPEFNEGFTVFDATGFYQGKSERSKVLSLIVSANAVDASLVKIRRIATTFVARFSQDSVMLTKTPVLEWEFIQVD